MIHLSSFILMTIVVIGMVCFYDYYYFDDDHKKAFWTVVVTIFMFVLFSFIFIKVGWLPDFLDVKNVKTELVSDKKTTEIFSAKKVYRDGENAIIEDTRQLLTYMVGKRKYITTLKKKRMLKLPDCIGTQAT